MSQALAIQPSPMALQAQRVCVELAHKPVVVDVDLTISQGTWTAIVGPNGAGKTTLLRALAGVLPVQHGRVQWLGKPLSQWTPQELAKMRTWLDKAEALNLSFRVNDLVMLGRLPWQNWWAAVDAQDHQAVLEAMRQTDVLDLADRDVLTLSSGQLQRVLLARALAAQTPIVMMDEPLTSLDAHHQMQLVQHAKQHVRQGGTWVTALHEISLALLADQIVVMQAGRVVHTGSPHDLVTHRAMEAVFEYGIRIVALPNGLSSSTGDWAVLPNTDFST